MPILGKKSQRRAQIYNTAVDLFRSKGYAAASMRELANQVGLEPASLYTHIRSKEEILHKICFDLMQHFYDRTENFVPGMEDCLSDLIQAHIDVILKLPGEAIIVQQDARFLKPEELQKFESLQRNYEWKFAEAIRTGIRMGKMREVNPRFAVKMIFSSTAWLPEWSLRQNTPPKPEIIHSSTVQILGGLQAA